MGRSEDSHSVRRIVLPSGKSIEVVRFKEETAVEQPLHICLECFSDLVQPVAWSEADIGQWEITLRCPNCLEFREVVASSSRVELFEEILDEGLAAILKDLQRLTHANMADQIDRFTAALHADQILPEDF